MARLLVFQPSDKKRVKILGANMSLVEPWELLSFLKSHPYIKFPMSCNLAQQLPTFSCVMQVAHKCTFHISQWQWVFSIFVRRAWACRIYARSTKRWLRVNLLTCALEISFKTLTYRCHRILLVASYARGVITAPTTLWWWCSVSHKPTLWDSQGRHWHSFVRNISRVDNMHGFRMAFAWLLHGLPSCIKLSPYLLNAASLVLNPCQWVEVNSSRGCPPLSPLKLVPR